MQLKSIIAAAGLTATATTNAFLLTPDVSADDIVTTLPVPVDAEYSVTHPEIVHTQKLKLNCPGCPVRFLPHFKGHHSGANANPNVNIPSHLELDFSIASSDSVDRLLLNGYELYPKTDPFRETLTAALLPDFRGTKVKRPHHMKGPRPQSVQPLGFGLQTRVIPSQDDDDDLDLVVVDLQVIEVGDVFIDGIPNVELKLLKTRTGKLMIADVTATESETAQNTPMDPQRECTTMFCKLIAMAKERFARLRAGKHCGGRRPVHAGQEHEDKQIDFDKHPVGHGHHGPKKHSWGHLFKNIATHILLPVAIGILAGVTASIVGMMAGTFLVYLWRTFVRRPSRSRRHNSSRGHGHTHKAGHRDAAAEDEKSGLMAHQEEVQAPPAYVEEGVVNADDQKPDNSV